MKFNKIILILIIFIFNLNLENSSEPGSKTEIEKTAILRRCARSLPSPAEEPQQTIKPVFAGLFLRSFVQIFC